MENCSLLKKFKIFLLFVGVLIFVEYILDAHVVQTVYTSSQKIKYAIPIKWPMQNGHFDSRKEIDFDFGNNPNAAQISIIKTNDYLELCPTSTLILETSKPVTVDLEINTLNDVNKQDFGLDDGGHFAPRHCKPNDKVAIIIPYRNRETHLAMFLNNMHPFLMKQNIEYTIYVVEQNGTGSFNRAKLFNVGFAEASKQLAWDCYIFHDVDLLPLDERNLYTCPPIPRHLTPAIDKYQFKLQYPTLFGGAVAIKSDQFKMFNGFSNRFWGWGGEDDDMYNRLKYHGFEIMRYPMSVARYTMLGHNKEEPNPKRFNLLKEGKLLFDRDGLNNLKYRLIKTEMFKMYTLILVELED